MSRRKNYKKEDVLKAIDGSGGLIATIAKRMRCDWHTAKRCINKWTETLQAYIDSEETVLDFVEGKAIERVKEGDGSMIRFILATKGRKRGYGEKPVIDETAADDTELRIIIDDDPKQ
nr:MAG TPA: Sf6 terminase small subunit gp1, octamer, DNA-binding, CAPS buffer.65A [Caudoviricetes sp.]